VQPPSPQPQPQPQPQQAAEFPMSLLQEVMDTCDALTRRVKHLDFDKRVETFDDAVMDDESNQGRMIAKMDQDDAVILKDDKEEDREVADEVKVADDAKVDESAQVQGRTAESQVEIYKIDMDHATKVLSMQEDETEPAKVQKVVDIVTIAKLIIEVVTVDSEAVTTASTIITTAEAQVPAAILIAAPARVAAAPSRIRKGVAIRDPEKESTTSIIIPAETKSKDKGKGILVEEPKPLKKKQQIEQDEQYSKELHAELNKDIDWDEAIDHVKMKAKEDPALKRYQVLKRKPQTKAQARKNMMVYLKNVTGFKMDYFKGLSYDDIRPVFEKALKRLNETPAEKAAKKQKLSEEVEELKRHLQIVLNEDDDVYTEATPLARKVPGVDYKIIKLNKKPHYKIIRADETHQLYSSKGQRMEATGIMWCTDHNIYIYPADFVIRKEIPSHKIYSRPDAECCKTEVEEESEVSLELLRFIEDFARLEFWFYKTSVWLENHGLDLKVGTSQRVETSDDTVMDDESNQGRMIAEIDQDDAVVLEDDKEEDKKVATAVKDVEEAKLDEIAAAPSRRRREVVTRDPEEESTTSTIIPAKIKSKDKGKGILVEEPKPLKKKQQIEQDKQYARELHAELNKDIDWDEAI
nr:hypothetical protein [Tanacetum cinerariifolium]